MSDRNLKIIGSCLVLAVIVATLVYSVASRLKRENLLGASSLDDIVLDGLINDMSQNLTSSTYSVTIPLAAQGMRGGCWAWSNMANATVDIFASNSGDLNRVGSLGAPTSTRVFIDVSNDMIGAANFSSNRIICMDTPIIYSYLRWTVTTSTSATSTWRLDQTLSSK